jgi:hypothetical protein
MMLNSTCRDAALLDGMATSPHSSDETSYRSNETPYRSDEASYSSNEAFYRQDEAQYRSNVRVYRRNAGRESG